MGRQPNGSKRLRGDSWQLRAYAGKVGGRERWLSLTLPPTAAGAADAEEADAVLARLVARAATLRDAERDARRAARFAQVLGETGGAS